MKEAQEAWARRAVAAFMTSAAYQVRLEPTCAALAMEESYHIFRGSWRRDISYGWKEMKKVSNVFVRSTFNM
jgi:hypothetical protein